MLDRRVSTHVPARNGPKGQGNFLVRGALLPGRGALCSDPLVHRTPFPNGIKSNPRNLCPVGHPRAGWRSPVLDLQTLCFHGLEQGAAQRILAICPQIVVEIAHVWHEFTTGNSKRFQLVTQSH